jgi:hypothetical protein
MSIVSQIVGAIEGIINANLPAYKASQYVWDTTKNSDSKNRQFYAIRPEAASFVSGTCRTITLEQTFQVELGDSFKNRGDKDTDANDKIMSLYEDHETLYREIMRNNFNIGRVQVVGNLDIDAPEVDNDNKVCRLVANYTIRYRTE